MAEQSLVATIACGVSHSIATGVKMGCWTWGANDYAQLGHSEGCPKVPEPVQVPEMCSRLVKQAAGGCVCMSVQLFCICRTEQGSLSAGTSTH